MICETTSVWSSEDFKISARVRQRSVTSNTLWASVNLFGQITVHRYVVFVSTVELRTLYIQELPYMNTFCECILKKIGPTHAHFQYNARKLTSINFWRKIAFSFQVMSGNILFSGNKIFEIPPFFQTRPGGLGKKSSRMLITFFRPELGTRLTKTI